MTLLPLIVVAAVVLWPVIHLLLGLWVVLYLDDPRPPRPPRKPPHLTNTHKRVIPTPAISLLGVVCNGMVGKARELQMVCCNRHGAPEP